MQRIRSSPPALSLMLALVIPGVLAAMPQQRGQLPAALRSALKFHASFDGALVASHAAGDPALYWAPTLKQRHEAKPGLPPGGQIQHAIGAGRFGDALRFTSRKSPVVFFQGDRNVPYAAADWSGTVSFWLSTDPERQLEPGFCDPVQITPRAWNDAAFFVEFEKREDGIPFRLGAYANLDVWNPGKRRFADIPAADRPLIAVEKPPFAAGKWTHVLFTFERFNTGRADGVVRLYLDGELRGELSPRQQTFTWEPQLTLIALGLNYVGLIDEIATFDRVVSAAEVRLLYTLKESAALQRQ